MWLLLEAITCCSIDSKNRFWDENENLGKNENLGGGEMSYHFIVLIGRWLINKMSIPGIKQIYNCKEGS